MRRFRDIWDDYADVVDFYALEVDPTADLSEIARVGRERDYSWTMGRAARSALSELRVRAHATKVAFDASGTIVYRAGYAQGDAVTWRGVFDDLAGR